MECEASLNIKMIGMEYRLLPEDDKRKRRIDMAEIIALKETLLAGKNLDEELQSCIKGEHYCGAEGVKRVKEWWKSINTSL